ncbi:hypothetical protein KI387_024600, partial [Taxus chinensis]
AQNQKAFKGEARNRKTSQAEARNQKTSQAEVNNRKASQAEVHNRKASQAEVRNRKTSQAEVHNRKASQAEVHNHKISQANNRIVLADIGNTVGDINGRFNFTKKEINGKAGPQGRRPITRSYRAQLLANTRVVATNGIAATDKHSKAEVVNINKQGRTKKSDDIPPTIVDVGDGTGDKTVVAEHTPRVKAAGNRNVRAVTTKGRPLTLTATLTARSEAFCCRYCAEKTEAEVLLPNIDKRDHGNQLAVVEYVEDIYKFYREMESQSCVPDYMPSQSEITEEMRAIVIDWLIEVHTILELTSETLFLTINVLDRYLSIESVSQRKLQLVGITAMLLASKYEEIWPPEMEDFVCISRQRYNRQQILTEEKTMLNKLKFHLTVPTPFVFVIRFLKAAGSDSQMENVAFFLLELSLLQYTMTKFRPSLLAAAAVFTAQCVLKKQTIWNDTLKRHTGYSEADLKECAKLMIEYHQISEQKENGMVHKKYSLTKFGSVALISPAQLPA